MRMTPTRCTVITALCLLWPAVSHAQPVPTAADVRARLHSRGAAEVAWAAFDAATFQMREVAPDLVTLLELPPAATPLAHDYLIAAVLDALVQLDDPLRIAGITPVPSPQILERYHSRWPVQTLILFGRTARDERGPLLQALLASASGDRWFALSNLLSSQAPVPGFAATLLNGVKLDLDIRVVDPGSGAGFGGGSGSGCFALEMVHGPSGFPPHAAYNFESGETPGAIVMSRGPRTVYYSRRVATRGIPSGGHVGEGPTTEDRLDYLNALIRATNYSFMSQLRPRTSISIEWTNARALRGEIETQQKKISDDYERMRQALMDLGYLTSEEADSLPLALDTEIHDLRRNPKPPLQ